MRAHSQILDTSMMKGGFKKGGRTMAARKWVSHARYVLDAHQRKTRFPW